MLRYLSVTANFTVDLMDSRDGTFGSQYPNGTWGGVIGMIMDNVSDFSIADITIYKERMEAVDFVNGITQKINRLFMKNPNNTFKWTTFINCFDKLFWIAVFIVFIGTAAGLHILKKFVRKEPNTDVGTSFGTVMCAFTALSIPTYPMRNPGRILIITILTTGALLFWRYNAVLVSQLSVQISSYPISSMKDLVGNSDYKLIVEDGSASGDYFQQATLESNPVSHALWHSHFKDTTKYFVPDLSEVEGMLVEDDTLVYFAPVLQTVLQMPRYPCQIISIPGATYFKAALSWPFQKDSQYLALFNHLIGQLKEVGFDQRMFNGVLQSKPKLACGEVSESGFKTIQYKDIFTAFIILFAGIFAALGISAYEKLNEEIRKI